MITGVLVAESLRSGSRIEGVPLVVRKLERSTPSVTTSHQPSCWTLIEFEVDKGYAGTLADILAEVLEEPGWYADFRSDDESVVVFPRRVFRYPRGDQSARMQAKAHARSLGIPESQLDWPE